jgi:tRNA(fMet)-specific endonuclease VapC
VLRYLLDTNTCVFVIRQKPATVLQRFQQYQPDELAISVVTLPELRSGADKSRDPVKNHATLDGFLAPLAIVDFDADAADWYGKVRSDLELRGCPIGPLDMLIAAHALRLGLPVVTNNVGEFSRVTGLNVEDWTIP